LPTDIVGLTTYIKEKDEFRINKGPIFANFIIADEINRSPPKTQSATLEAMQEKQVTIGNETFKLPNPFFVMATQNPIESSGIYPLPEAQIDRFLFKIKIIYPKLHEENEILKKNITLKRFEEVGLKVVTTPSEIVKMQDFVKKIYLSKDVENYIVKLVDATRNPNKYKILSGRYIEWGCSPRASIGLYIASKAEALIKGHDFVTPAHVKTVAYDVMRHRMILNYEGQAENIKTDDIVTEILSKVPIP
jgi:MoxR-like ATPase